MLAEALGTLVGPPLMAMQTPEQALEERAEKGSSEELPKPPLPPEEMAAVMQEVLDNHYRTLLSQPIPMLDGKTPKQAVRSKSGRQKVVEWLKLLENNEAHRAAATKIPPYDFTWMWDALKIRELRQ